MSALVFLDTETLGLGLTDPIWEIAAIRREPNGQEYSLHFHVGDSFGAPLTPPEDFPERFRGDFDARYGKPHGISAANDVRDALRDLFRERPHVVGAVPNFDTERIAHQFGVTGWHYHLIDVENLAVGALAAQGVPLAPPWDSNELSRAVGVDPARFRRHQAMADVEWVRALYDRIMGTSQAPGRVAVRV